MVKLYLDEEDSEVVYDAVEAAEGVANSTVAYAETRAAFARRKRIGDLDDEGLQRAIRALDNDWRTYVRLAASNLVAYRAGVLAERYALRGFDAIHLASADRLEERFSDVYFLAFDARLMEAAREAAMRVYVGE